MEGLQQRLNKAEVSKKGIEYLESKMHAARLLYYKWFLSFREYDLLCQIL